MDGEVFLDLEPRLLLLLLRLGLEMLPQMGAAPPSRTGAATALGTTAVEVGIAVTIVRAECVSVGELDGRPLAAVVSGDKDVAKNRFPDDTTDARGSLGLVDVTAEVWGGKEDEQVEVARSADVLRRSEDSVALDTMALLAVFKDGIRGETGEGRLCVCE